MGKRTWTRFEPGVFRPGKGLSAEDMAEHEKVRAEGIVTIWINNLFTVQVTSGRGVLQAPPPEFPELVWFSIRRNERARLPRDWRDLQRVKNELAGPEHEAVEMFPAESRLVDSADQFHLWVIADPEVRWPFGYLERDVADHGEVEKMGGSQRKLDPTPHHEPIGLWNLTEDLRRRAREKEEA